MLSIINFKMILVVVFLLGGTCVANDSPWRWEGGATLGDPGPAAVDVGLHYRQWGVRYEGGFWVQHELTWWTTSRLSLDYAWIARPHYSLETGVAGTYYFNQARDSLALELNHLMGQRVMYDAQWTDWLGIGPEIAVNWYGLFVQASLPLLEIGSLHRKLEWRAGLIF